MIYNPTNLANALAARERATAELRTLTARGVLTDAQRQRETALMAEVRSADNSLREAVSNGAHIQSQIDSQRPGLTFRATTDGLARRNLADVRVFNTAFSEMREADFVSDTSSEYASTMLAAAPNGSRLLGRLNSFPFGKTRGAVPVAPRVTAQLQPRNEAIADAATLVTVSSFQTVKPTAITTIDRDALTDYPGAEAAIEAALLSGVGQRVDHVLVNGGTDGDVTVAGLLTEGMTTTAAAGETSLTADHLIDAVARVENAGGTPSAVIGSPAEIRAIERSVSSQYGAAYLARLPEFVAIPDLADGTVSVPAGTLVVADLAQVGVASRAQLELTKLTQEESVYSLDQVAIAARTRVGEITVAEHGHIQVIKAAAV